VTALVGAGAGDGVGAGGCAGVTGVAGAGSWVDDIGSVEDDRCWVPGNVDSFMTRQTFQPIRAIPATVSVHSSTLNQPLRSRVGWFAVDVPDRADHPARVTIRDGMIAHRPQYGVHRVPAGRQGFFTSRL